jgi:two-component system sensor histidine kinase CiaH
MELGPLLSDVWRTAQALSERVSVRLGEVAADVQVAADADRLVQLFLILLENAVRYSPPGSQVWVRATLESRRQQPGVRVDVEDAGPGVPASERSRIFERFYRSRQTEATADGVGLGLAVARWIATEHHAELGVVDNEPTGAIFQVWLPVSTG